ncbi:MAG: flavin reductase family protein [Candidatus Kapabacteria bacterium]|nr:flavin reductase family protein [Candidatus Kapabacteria bacterium]
MRTILPNELSHRDRHQLLLSGVSPRPIAFVTSVDLEGNVNLSPFSFYNAYASNPPIVAIGPAIAAKSGRAKHTWLNILATGECTISAVSYSMVHSMNLTAAEYPHEVDEYGKAGFTKRPSVQVIPPSVAESPYSLECRLMENIELRRDIGGNGNLMLLEVVAFHVADSVMIDGRVDPRGLDLVGRMGHAYYTRTQDLFEAVQPPHLPIGIDGLPDLIRTSTVLTGNELAQLAYVPGLPMHDGSFPQFDQSFRADSLDIELSCGRPEGALYVWLQNGDREDKTTLHRIAQMFIGQNKIDEAWQTLLLE